MFATSEHTHRLVYTALILGEAAIGPSLLMLFAILSPRSAYYPPVIISSQSALGGGGWPSS